MINTTKIFRASCLALLVTAFTFAIRANLMGNLGLEFNLNSTELGHVAGAAFWGFTLAMVIGGFLCDVMGIGKLFLLAFITHLAGLVLTIFSVGLWSLFFSTLLVGLGNGFVESASYSMVSSLYPSEKTKKINEWHIWFPAGIMIGGLVSYGISNTSLDWRWQIAFMILPTIVYGFMFFGEKFPKSERIMMGVSNKNMFKSCLSPQFLLLVFCMLLTSATELGTNQWITELLSSIGVPSILLLVFINGIMTFGRANAGFFLKRMDSLQLLLWSSVFSFLGLLGLSYFQGLSSFFAAAIFAAGICFFWPTMIGFVAEKMPKTGPLGLSIMGGAGLFSTALVMPIFGYINDINLEKLKGTGVNLDQMKLEAGSTTLLFASIFPGILIVIFLILNIKMSRNKNPGFSQDLEFQKF